MNDRELQACKTARTLSSMAALITVLATLILSRTLNNQSMHWQVVVATVALAAGIPHGALDHLVARPVGNGSTMTGFVVRYVLTAIVSLVAILFFNVIGFVFVLVMSAVHFGSGDAAFIAEIDKRVPPSTKHRAFLYAVPAGLLPIVVPLTKSTSENALNEINTSIVRWHAGFDSALLVATGLISLAAAMQPT
jgi:Brp/Blh family beta-carotene 15,15'-monooxygenase